MNKFDIETCLLTFDSYFLCLEKKRFLKTFDSSLKSVLGMSTIALNDRLNAGYQCVNNFDNVEVSDG